jgi:hypothetical protein
MFFIAISRDAVAYKNTWLFKTTLLQMLASTDGPCAKALSCRPLAGIPRAFSALCSKVQQARILYIL